MSQRFEKCFTRSLTTDAVLLFALRTIRETNAAKTVSNLTNTEIVFYHKWQDLVTWRYITDYLHIMQHLAETYCENSSPSTRKSPFISIWIKSLDLYSMTALSHVFLVLWKPTYLISPVENIFRPALKLAIQIQELLNPMLADMICILFRIFPRQRWSFGQQPHGWIPT